MRYHWALLNRKNAKNFIYFEKWRKWNQILKNLLLLFWIILLTFKLKQIDCDSFIKLTAWKQTTSRCSTWQNRHCICYSQCWYLRLYFVNNLRNFQQKVRWLPEKQSPVQCGIYNPFGPLAQLRLEVVLSNCIKHGIDKFRPSVSYYQTPLFRLILLL